MCVCVISFLVPQETAAVPLLIDADQISPEREVNSSNAELSAAAHWASRTGNDRWMFRILLMDTNSPGCWGIEKECVTGGLHNGPDKSHCLSPTSYGSFSNAHNPQVLPRN